MELLLDAESQIETWQEVILVYNAALKQINTKLEILNDEFQHVHQYNPIEHIKSRLKTADSIVKKLKKDGCESDHRQYDEPFKRYCRYPHYLFFYF